jgi:hypothetical protein
MQAFLTSAIAIFRTASFDLILSPSKDDVAPPSGGAWELPTLLILDIGI